MTLPLMGAMATGSAVGVGGGETGEGKEEALEELLLPLLAVKDVDGVDEEEEEVVDEQRDPHRDPDSRRWLSMWDVSAAAVL